jgi:predicted  nucleic acid-binding Zn-ribbon protein
MNDQQLSTFIALVTFDQKILSMQKERDSLIHSRSVLVDKKISLDKNLEALLQLVHDLKKEVDESELSMKILDQQESQKKRCLDNASNSREYVSLKNEIAVIHDKQRDQEPVLIEAWDKLDATQKKYQAEQIAYKKAVEEIDRETSEINIKVEDLTKLIDEHEESRATFVNVVSAELLENYEHMRGMVSDPVVAVVYNSCSACYYPVPAQDLTSLKKGKLLPCKSCYRILYIEDAKQSA